MSRLTVTIDNKKTEKVVLAVLQALGLSYTLDSGDGAVGTETALNSAEIAMCKRLKESFEEIASHQKSKIKLMTIEEVLAEIS